MNYIDPDGQMVITVPVILVHGLFAFGTAYYANKAINEMNNNRKARGGCPNTNTSTNTSNGDDNDDDENEDDEVTEERIKRKNPGRDGAESEHIFEKQNNVKISKTQRVTKDGKVIHQHKDHIGKSGKYRRFPNKWIR